MEGVIEVYKDWSADELPKRLGTLRVHSGRTGELFDLSLIHISLLVQAVGLTRRRPTADEERGRRHRYGKVDHLERRGRCGEHVLSLIHI